MTKPDPSIIDWAREFYQDHPSQHEKGSELEFIMRERRLLDTYANEIANQRSLYQRGLNACCSRCTHFFELHPRALPDIRKGVCTVNGPPFEYVERHYICGKYKEIWQLWNNKPIHPSQKEQP